MKIFFSNSNFPNSVRNNFTRTGTRILLTAALAIIGLGILILISPLILFLFVAALALLAITLLSIAWKVHRIKKSHTQPTDTPNDHPHHSNRIHVESHTFDINQQ